MRQGAKARGDELRQALLDAAERRLAQGGLTALTVRQLAADAGCGAGTINYVFGSLDELVLAANERTLVQIAAAMDGVIRRTEGASRAERMAALATAYLRYAGENRARWSALFLHQVGDGAEVPAWYADRRDALIARIAEVIRDATMTDAQAVQTALMVFEAIHGVVSLGLDQKLGGQTDAEIRGRVSALVAILAAGLDAAA